MGKTVATAFDVATGWIEQTLFDGRSILMRQMMNIKERQVHDALVAMGWTPPQAASPAQEGVVERVALALEREFDRVVDECNGTPDFEAAAHVAIAAFKASEHREQGS